MKTCPKSHFKEKKNHAYKERPENKRIILHVQFIKINSFFNKIVCEYASIANIFTRSQTEVRIIATKCHLQILYVNIFPIHKNYIIKFIQK